MSGCSRSFSVAEFFKDTPWLKVAPERLSTMILQPVYPRGGLLGGSAQVGTGKPSKLAALAAARKKAQEEKKRSADTERSHQDDGQAKATEPERLASKRKAEDTRSAADGYSQRKTVQVPQRSYPRREKLQPEPEPELSTEKATPLTSPETQQQGPKANAEDLKATPSVFAQTMLGRNIHTSPKMTGDNLLPLLYSKNLDATNNPFAGPSPDDIVTNAQSKGVRG